MCGTTAVVCATSVSGGGMAKVAKTRNGGTIDYELMEQELGHHWQGDPDPDNSFGFLYTIINLLEGRMYVGKKQYWSYRRIKVAGKRNRVKKVLPNKWEFYTGSCTELNADIKRLGKENFIFALMQNMKTKGGLHYGEIDLQVTMKVLTAKREDGTPIFYNRQIAGCKFIPPEEVSDETRAKMSEAMTGKYGTRNGSVASTETKALMRTTALRNGTRPPIIRDKSQYLLEHPKKGRRSFTREEFVSYLSRSSESGISLLLSGKSKSYYGWVLIDALRDERYLKRYQSRCNKTNEERGL